MNDMATSLVWCMVQVTLVGIAAWAVYLAAGRGGPALRGRVAFTGLLVMALLTVMVASPWPRWQVSFSIRPSSRGDAAAAPIPSLSESRREVDLPGHAADDAQASPAESLRSRGSNEPALELTGALAASQDEPAAARDTMTQSGSESGGSAGSNRVDRSPSGRGMTPSVSWHLLAAILVFGGLFVGTLRLTAGLLSVAGCRRRATLVDDPPLLRIVSELRDRLACRRPIEVRQSSEIASAATVGFRRPAVLLPDEWTGWSDEQLRAVLAHETAHVARHDFLTWMMAQAALVLHFYHPLVHWLAGRLRLEQEMAADAAAAALTGGRQRFLSVLAEMALTASNRGTAWPARAFLPERGMLIRRIEMLRDAPQTFRPPSAVVAGISIGLILLAGVAAAGFRSPVDNPSALLALADGQESSRSVDGSGRSAEPSSRPVLPLDTSYVPDDAAVVISLLPSRLATADATKPLVDYLQESPLFKHDLGLSLEAIDQVLMIPLRTSARVAPPRRDPLLALGTTIIRMKNPTDFQTFTDNVLPQPVTRSWRGQQYLAAGTGENGGDSLCVLLADDRTIILDYESSLQRIIATVSRRPPRLITSDAWQAVRTSHLAAAVDGRWLANTLDAPGRGGGRIRSGVVELAVFSPVWEESDVLALGGNAGEQIELLGIADCADEAGAGRVTETLNAFVTLARNGIVRYRDEFNRSAPRHVRDKLLAVVDLAESLLHTVKITQAGETVSAATTASLEESLIELVIDGTKNSLTSRRRENSRNNLKQIGIAMHNYHDVHDRFPAASMLGPDGKTVHSWRVAILPYIGHAELYEQYRLTEPWDSPHNRQVASQMPEAYRHPNAPADTTNACYFVLAGPATAFPGVEGLSIRQFLDGTSNTILVVEANRDVPWTKPEDIPFDAAKPLPKLGGFEPDGSHVLLSDGSVRWLSKGVDPELLKKWITPAGREVVQSFPSQGEDAKAAAVTADDVVPSSRRSRPAESSSKQNLKQIGIAMHNYHDRHGRFPAASMLGPDGKTVHSWRVAILPYIGHAELYEQYRLTEPWDSPHNRQVAKQMPEAYRHPNAPADTTNACYFVLAGPATAFPGVEGLSIEHFLDGTSNTILLVEASRDVPWTKPEDIPFDAAKPLPKLGGFEPEGSHVLLGDGSVRWLSKGVDPELLKKWITPAGREVVQSFPSQGEDAKAAAAQPSTVRRQPAESSSRQNLKELVLAMHNYHDRHGRLPPATLLGPDGKTVHSWRVAILPLINQTELYEQYRLNEPWDSPHNLQVAKQMPQLYRHPDAAADSTDACYFALTGPRTVFRGPEGQRFRDITDGTSNTIMLVEAKRAIPWTKPEDIPFDPAKPLPKLGGFEPLGTYVGVCDGSVMLMSKDADPDRMKKWISADGGEVVPPIQTGAVRELQIRTAR